MVQFDYCDSMKIIKIVLDTIPELLIIFSALSLFGLSLDSASVIIVGYFMYSLWLAVSHFFVAAEWNSFNSGMYGSLGVGLQKPRPEGLMVLLGLVLLFVYYLILALGNLIVTSDVVYILVPFIVFVISSSREVISLSERRNLGQVKNRRRAAYWSLLIQIIIFVVALPLLSRFELSSPSVYVVGYTIILIVNSYYSLAKS